jgi:hypothetical protein
MTVRYLDPFKADDSGDGLSRANAKKRASALPSSSGGDEVRIVESTRVNAGSWTWPAQGGKTVTAPTGTAKLIDLLSATTGWVAATDVTITTNTTIPVAAANSLNIAVAAGFTTGKAAHKPLGSVFDLSGYTQVGFFLRYTNVSVVTAAYLDFCSDTSGDTPVLSIRLELGFTAVSSVVFRFNYDHGGPLPSNIQSIAVRFASDPGANALLLQDLFATKAQANGGCTLFDSITTNNADSIADFVGDEVSAIYAIHCVTADDTYALNTCASPITVYTGGRGHDAIETGALTTYVYRGLPMDIATNAFPIPGDGAVGNNVICSGGWDVTNMSTRSGISIWAWRLLTTSGTAAAYNTYFTFQEILLNGFPWTTPYKAGTFLNRCGCLGTTSFSGGGNTSGGLIDTFLAVGGSVCPLGGRVRVANLTVRSQADTSGSPNYAGYGATLKNVISTNCAMGIQVSAGGPDDLPVIFNLVVRRTATALRILDSGGCAALRGVKVYDATTVVQHQTKGMRIKIDDLDTSGNWVISDFFGEAYSEGSVVNGTETASMRLVPVSLASKDCPFVAERVPWMLTRGVANTLTIAARRANTGTFVGLLYCPCQEGADYGLTSRADAWSSAAINTWGDISITLTPTGAGTIIVMVELCAYGTAANGYLGKLRFS